MYLSLPIAQSEAELRRKHGALGLSAVLESRPYDVPDWMPEALVLVANHIRDPKPVDGTSSHLPLSEPMQ